MLNIESLSQNSESYAPPAAFCLQARLNRADADALRAYATAQPEAFWANSAQDLIAWQTPFTQVLNASHAPFYRWFEDGILNVSYNCLDRHLPHLADKVALIFEADDGQVRHVTYQMLYHEVCQFANGLRAQGVEQGDRVMIYMPMSVEAVVAMQACARLGCIHSVVFAGFSAKSLHERLLDTGAACLITGNASHRAGKRLDLKAVVDEALDLGLNHPLKKVIVYQRDTQTTPMQTGRDIWWQDCIAGQAKHCEPVWVNAEHPLFILYTSGSTGKPKGLQHSSAGYLLGAMLSMRWVFDARADDVFWCTADVGWITGHSYVAYAPLALGLTQVIFEGVPSYPQADRFWQMIARHQVSIFYTAPTAIRTLIKLGEHWPRQHDLSSLRLLGTVGEPINPEAWRWYHQEIGGGRCPIVDTWWQTETGSHVIAPIPAATSLKPGSCTQPLPGMQIEIRDEQGHALPAGQGGALVITQPFPSLARTIWGDDARFARTYFPEIMGGAYLAGDSAYQNSDGFVWILGRLDDVINVSGHRLGTMEIESALVAHESVAESAVVARPHPIKGEAIVAFVMLKDGYDLANAEHAACLKKWVTHEIGALARPEEIRFTQALPKTRSGKIMRRLLRSLACGETISQDISTLENPALLETLAQTGW